MTLPPYAINPELEAARLATWLLAAKRLAAKPISKPKRFNLGRLIAQASDKLDQLNNLIAARR